MNKNLIISFAPGAKGFLLSKWLYINRTVNFWTKPDSISLNLDQDNHHLNPFYNDVLFYWTDKTSQQLFNEIEQCLVNQSADYNYITLLLEQSAFSKSTMDNNNPYNLILSHHGTQEGLSILSKCLDARVIRITFADMSQAKECYLRKFNEEPDLNYFNNYYGLYLNNYDSCINVSLDNVANLNLDFLKEELK